MVFILPFPKVGSFLMLGIDMSCYICSYCVMLLPKLYKHDKLAGGNLLRVIIFIHICPNLSENFPGEDEKGDQSTLFLKIGQLRKREDK